MNVKAIATLAALIAVIAAPRADVAAEPVGTSSAECTPQDGLQFICGPVASEDLARVPGTPWLIASGLNLGAPAHLYLIDTRDRTFSPGFPAGAPRMELDRKATPNCSGPPDLSRISTDGLALRAGRNGKHTLYAANHGDRMAIEVFEVDARASRPELRWIGCMPLPEHSLPNGVAVLPDGGILVTSFYDPTNPDESWARMARGETSGRLLEWHVQSGFRDVPDAAFSGPNGVELSADGAQIYVSAWAAREIVVLSRADGARREIPLDFMPDNIHRLENGSLLVGGQQTSVQAIAACKAQCPQRWRVALIDPRKGSVTTLLAGPGTTVVNYAAGAVAVDGTLYITVRGERRIAFKPLSELPH